VDELGRFAIGWPGPGLAGAVPLVDVGGDGVVEAGPEVDKQREPGEGEHAEMGHGVGVGGWLEEPLDHLVDSAGRRLVVGRVRVGLPRDAPEVDLDPEPIGGERERWESVGAPQDRLGCRIAPQVVRCPADVATHPEHDRSLTLRTAGDVPDERLVVVLDGEHLVDIEQVSLEEIVDLAVAVPAQQHHVVGGVALGFRERMHAPGRPRALLLTHVVSQLTARHLPSRQ
jgi:hypothetical protein